MDNKDKEIGIPKSHALIQRTKRGVCSRCSLSITSDQPFMGPADDMRHLNLTDCVRVLLTRLIELEKERDAAAEEIASLRGLDPEV